MWGDGEEVGEFFNYPRLTPLYVNQKEWNLSRSTENNLPQIKDLGDSSAHRLHYNAVASSYNYSRLTYIQNIR